MLLFLDTEYTGEGQADPGLISLGLVAEDGQREFYVELADTWRREDCNGFVLREVLPRLDGSPLTIMQARLELRHWFAAAPRYVQVACDSSTDFRFLLQLLDEPRPRNLDRQYLDLRPLIDTTVYDRAVSDFYQTDDKRIHHALVDARAYRRGWLAWMDLRKGPADRPAD